MRETLYIRLRPGAPGSTLAYALVSETAAGVRPSAPPGIFVREAPLGEVLALAGARRVVVFVPAADVRLTTVKVPARQPAKVLQAAPFVLEDQFAEDVETLHFALGARRADGSWPIAAVSHLRMREWLAPFQDAGIPPYALVPESLALPWEDHGPWPVLAEAAQITARTGACAGFSCLPEDFELYLQLAEPPAEMASENAAPHALRVLVPRGTAEDYTRLQRPVELLPGYEHPLEALIRNLRLPSAINLLQGAYSQREDFDRVWRPWKLAASLALAAFALGVAVNGVDAWRLARAVTAQDQANLERFHQLFPRETRIVDISAQTEQQIAALRGGNGRGGLFFLLQQAAAGLAAAPGLTLKELQFREGALYLDLSGTDLQVLETLRGWFAGHPGARLDVQSANAGEGGVQIRVKLSAA